MNVGIPDLDILEATVDEHGPIVRIPSYRGGSAYVGDVERLAGWMTGDGDEIVVRMMFGEDDRRPEVDGRLHDAVQAWVSLSDRVGRTLRLASLRRSHDALCVFALAQHHVLVHPSVAFSPDLDLPPGLASLLSARGMSTRTGMFPSTPDQLHSEGLVDGTFEGDAYDALASVMRHLDQKKVGVIGIMKAIERAARSTQPDIVD